MQLVDVSPFCPRVEELRICPQRASVAKDCQYCRFNTHETEDWQKMMYSCRQACHILGEEFQEPEFLNWRAGSKYHQALWNRIYLRTRQS